MKIPTKKTTAKPTTKMAVKVLTAAEKAAIEAKKKAEVARKEAEKLEREAKKDIAAVKAAAVKDAAAKKKEALHQRFVTATKKALDIEAKTINVRIDKAAKMMRDADDHRLAAAIHLDDAKVKCKEAKLSFQGWCEENIKQSYQTIRQLLPVGAAENDEEGAGKLMLTDMREKNKAANKKLRDKNKAAATASIDTPTAKKKEDPAIKALDGLKAMPKMQRETLIRSQMDELGFKAVSVDEPVKPATGTPRKIAQDAFNAMGAKVKIAFTRWAAEQIGAALTMDETGDDGDDDDDDGADHDPMAIPRGLRR